MTAERIVVQNRRARFDYEIGDVFEAGMVLKGTEVKSLRTGRGSIAEAYCRPDQSGFLLVNADIPIYAPSSRFNHEPKRPRLLLLNRREVKKLIGLVRLDGMTLVPLRIYFNNRGIAKLMIGVGKGKKAPDKREAEKKRDWQRQKARLMRNRG